MLTGVSPLPIRVCLPLTMVMVPRGSAEVPIVAPRVTVPSPAVNEILPELATRFDTMPLKLMSAPVVEFPVVEMTNVPAAT